MPSGAKKRKAAKKKKEQAVHQINISTKSNHGNNDHRSDNNQNENDHLSKIIEESKIKKELESEENIEIINHSSPHQEKSSSSSSSSSSNGSSSDDDIDKEERDLTDADTSFADPISKEQIQIENISDQSSVISVVDSMASNMDEEKSLPNVNENTSIDISASEEKTDADTPFDHPISKEQIQMENMSDPSSVISAVDSLDEEKSLPIDISASDEKSLPISDDPIHGSNAVPEGIKESEEIEATERSTIGIARRTSWLNCCGLFEVITGGSTK